MCCCLIFCAMLTTACEPRLPVFVERDIPAPLITPCSEQVQGPATEGGFAELALGWKHTSRCNAGKLERIGSLYTSSDQPQ